MSRTDRIALAGLLGLVALAFARSLAFGFVYDDVPVILENPTFGTPGLLSRIFAENVWSFAPELAEPRYYRPTFVAWLHGTWMLTGLNPVGWHLSTLLLHLIATATVYVFSRRFTGSTTTALLGSALFALHPARAESVAWVLGSTDPLAAMFGFGAMAMLLRDRPDLGAESTPPLRGAEALAAGLFTLALMSKETSVVFVCAPAGLAFFGDTTRSLRARFLGGVRLAAPWLVIAVAYFALRQQVIGALSPAYQELSAADQLRTQVVLLGTYVDHLVLPGRLSLTVPVGVITSWNDPQLLESLPGVILATGIFGAAALWGGRGRLLLWLGLGFLLPVLRVESLQPDMMFQDRYLYLPSACWLPGLVWGMERASRKVGWPDRGVASIVGLVLMFLLMVLQTNLGPWQTNRALWERAVEVHPESGRAWFNLGTEHENADDLARAEDAYMRAATLEPGRAIFHFRLAFMFAERGALQDARTSFARAAALRPGDPMLLYEAGRIERHVGDASEAARLLDAAAAAIQAGAPSGGGVTLADVERERRAVGIP